MHAPGLVARNRQDHPLKEIGLAPFLQGKAVPYAAMRHV